MMATLDMLRRRLSSIRSRMVALILVAAVPLLLMAVTITWQNYDYAFRQSREQVRLMRAAEVARHEEAIGGTRQMLGALANVPSVVAAIQPGAPEISARRCDTVLKDVLTLFPERYVTISVARLPSDPVTRLPSDPVTRKAGDPVCQASGSEPTTSDWVQQESAMPWYAAMLAAAQPGIGSLRAGVGGGAPLLAIGAPIMAGGRVAGAVLTLAKVDWLARPIADKGPAALEWLVDGGGGVLAAVGAAPARTGGGGIAPDSGLPVPEAFAGLVARDGVITSPSRGGEVYAYASARLADGLRLLIGYQVTAGEASDTLIRRIAALVLLVLLGLAAVLAGAQHAVVAPVRRLEGAVRRWRNGSAFETSLAAELPRELRDLAHSFAEASEALLERERQLRRALAQQELLMQEIHHRVKNNLQIIASLLNLQSSRIRMPQARAEFQSARDRVRSLATLHRYLYSHGEVHTINMRSFLTELCGQLFEAMGETVGERIRLDIDATELRMLSDQAVPLSLIVTEIVGNALKYAFPDGRAGRIGIRLTTDDTMAELLIEDDGVGLPPGASLGSATGALPPVQGGGGAGAGASGANSPGIGMQLIRGFVRQLHATLEINETRGTRYLLHLPMQPERPEPGAEPGDADRPPEAGPVKVGA